MTKVKVSELRGAALDWAVAKCEGRTDLRVDYDGELVGEYWFDYSTDWVQGGPIIEREECWPTRYWGAAKSRGKVYQALAYNGSRAYMTGPSPLIAAMRCYVASKLGEVVDIPEHLNG